MRTLILDRYAHQSIFKRLLGNILTGLAWVFWIYLWLPLFEAIPMLMDSNPEEAPSVASRSILGLVTTLGIHASMVFAILSAFIAWSVLQWAGKHHRHKALQQVKISHPVPMAYPRQDVKLWRKTQNMVVKHDDASGNIYQVEISSPNPGLRLEKTGGFR